ncbi:hypothetical protein Q6348_08000 [Isoptericola sp. b441]|uniref:Uncharacterized protein n=1 Tax=Actinotalea lenta TaxID=3064654 RepID=A0ABT9D8C3_9CELL|nr:hypothetical protein [Isoptericola sp. b441]MDO8107137.1 hypothetical protein [Isoptericola sp. b441]
MSGALVGFGLAVLLAGAVSSACDWPTADRGERAAIVVAVAAVLLAAAAAVAFLADRVG